MQELPAPRGVRDVQELLAGLRKNSRDFSGCPGARPSLVRAAGISPVVAGGRRLPAMPSAGAAGAGSCGRAVDSDAPAVPWRNASSMDASCATSCNAVTSLCLSQRNRCAETDTPSVVISAPDPSRMGTAAQQLPCSYSSMSNASRRSATVLTMRLQLLAGRDGLVREPLEDRPAQVDGPAARRASPGTACRGRARARPRRKPFETS